MGAKEDIVLAKRIAEKDQVAINEYVRSYQKFVYAVIFRFLKDEFQTEDATQEVLLRSIRKISSYKGNSTLKTWLYTIASNQAKNILRKNKLRSFFSISDDESYLQLESKGLDPHQEYSNTELAMKIQAALDSLPEKQRETFVLRYYEDLPYEEISQLLGTSVGGLKANYFHATKKMAELLKDEV
ncbi:MAG: sigma-70 family RNA polymerase sigma factor [Candidatus Kapaibacteriales bacterium]